MKKDHKLFRFFLNAQDALKNYTPADKHFTSNSEIDYISTILGLKFMDVEEMREMRNMVVIYYTHLMENTSRNNPQYDDYMQGMMSVTAVIDHVSHGETA